MPPKKKGLSDFNSFVPDGEGLEIGIVVAEWNNEITSKLRDGAVEFLKKHGVNSTDILIKHVPGSFELPLAASWLLSHSMVDAVICIGCVIKGETPHFDYICSAVSKGIMDLNLQSGNPVIFGVLTVENMQQAVERAGGKYGNKGEEAAFSALKMLGLLEEFIDEEEAEDEVDII